MAIEAHIGRNGTRVLRALVAAVVLLPLAATSVLAHPLGNFTINHHTGIRVEPDRVLLDVVIDQAEIPTFQAVMDLDEDGDGEFSEDELLAAETAGCTSVGEALSLTIDRETAPLRVIEAGVTFPPGPNLPRRGPSTRIPASAAQPPTLCTTVEPAKSQKPAVASQPPPQIQWPVTG